MTAIAAPSPTLHSSRSHARRRRLSVGTTGDADVLLRVLTVLRRRGFRIVRVDYEAGDRHRPTVLELSIESTSRTAHQLEAWLCSVVGVVSVEDMGVRAH